jgi:TRAP-type C4-dicarboxylate transport system permease small subunit
LTKRYSRKKAQKAQKMKMLKILALIVLYLFAFSGGIQFLGSIGVVISSMVQNQEATVIGRSIGYLTGSVLIEILLVFGIIRATKSLRNRGRIGQK